MLKRHRARLLPALLGLFVFSVYVFTAPNDLQGNGDTLLRYQTTQSMVDCARIYYCAPNTPTWTDKRVIAGVNGKLVTIYDPAQSVAMVPLYIAGKFIAHHFTQDYIYTPLYVTHLLDDIFAALTAIVFFYIALRLGYSRRVSALLTLIFAFASVLWPDAESMLEHTQVTFFLMLAVLCVMDYVSGGMKKRWWIVASALALGAAFLTRYDTGILFPLFPLYMAAARIARRKPLLKPVDQAEPDASANSVASLTISSLRDMHTVRAILTDWMVYVVGLIPAFVAAGLWNNARFGSPFKTGIPSTFGEPILQGLTGLLMSPGKGIIWYMPILFALPFVALPFYRQNRILALFFAAIVAITVLLYSTVIYWHGDPAWGPRYIYSATPFLVLPLGILLERWSELTVWAKRLFIAAVFLSFAVQVVGVVTPQYRFWYREIHSQLAARQGFNWGEKNGHFWYYYYWEPDRNPIVQGFQNMYELTALRVLGQNQYELGVSPIPTYEHLNLSNPTESYEINNFNVWWLAARTPLVGTHRDGILAVFWLLVAGSSFWLLWREMRYDLTSSETIVVELRRKPA